MPDERTHPDDGPVDDREPDEHPDGEHRGDDSDRSAMDGAEAEAALLAGRDPDEYPSVLRITATAEAEHRRDALDRLARWEAGESVPHVVNFQDPSDLRALLTDRRIELLHSVRTDSPASIRALADRLDRDVKTVHDDLGVLSSYDVVLFEQDGRAKRPFVPYDTIEVKLEISAPEDAMSA